MWSVSNHSPRLHRDRCSMRVLHRVKTDSVPFRSSHRMPSSSSCSRTDIASLKCGSPRNLQAPTPKIDDFWVLLSKKCIKHTIKLLKICWKSEKVRECRFGSKLPAKCGRCIYAWVVTHLRTMRISIVYRSSLLILMTFWTFFLKLTSFHRTTEELTTELTNLSQF